jgi:hypothetical protein
MSEEEILSKLKHYTKLWKKGGFISGALKGKLDNLFFYKDWDIAGISNKETRQKKWLAKMRGACAFLRLNRKPYPRPHHPCEQRRLQRPS